MPAALFQQIALRHHVPQFLGADALPLGVRITAEQLDHGIGGHGQQPDDGPHDFGQDHQRRGQDPGEADGALHGQPLGHQFTQDQREIGHQQRHADKGHRLSRRAESKAFQDGFDVG
ncbi:hypothetical protein D9M72_472420 [compost metagenome]